MCGISPRRSRRSPRYLPGVSRPHYAGVAAHSPRVLRHPARAMPACGNGSAGREARLLTPSAAAPSLPPPHAACAFRQDGPAPPATAALTSRRLPPGALRIRLRDARWYCRTRPRQGNPGLPAAPTVRARLGTGHAGGGSSSPAPCPRPRRGGTARRPREMPPAGQARARGECARGLAPHPGGFAR